MYVCILFLHLLPKTRAPGRAVDDDDDDNRWVKLSFLGHKKPKAKKFANCQIALKTVYISATQSLPPLCGTTAIWQRGDWTGSEMFWATHLMSLDCFHFGEIIRFDLNNGLFEIMWVELETSYFLEKNL